MKRLIKKIASEDYCQMFDEAVDNGLPSEGRVKLLDYDNIVEQPDPSIGLNSGAVESYVEFITTYNKSAFDKILNTTLSDDQWEGICSYISELLAGSGEALYNELREEDLIDGFIGFQDVNHYIDDNIMEDVPVSDETKFSMDYNDNEININCKIKFEGTF